MDLRAGLDLHGLEVALEDCFDDGGGDLLVP
jgi:hypothetical protein